MMLIVTIFLVKIFFLRLKKPNEIKHCEITMEEMSMHTGMWWVGWDWISMMLPGAKCQDPS